MKDLHVVILVKRVSSSKCELALGGSETIYFKLVWESVY